MHPDYYEFLGHLFLNMGRGQKQMTEMDKLFRQTFQGYESLLAAVRQISNPDEIKKFTDDYRELTGKILQSFEATFRDTMNIFQVVPKEDYEKLRQKCEMLEKTLAEKEETIRYLKTLWGQKEDSVSSAANEIQTILKKQHAEYEKMLDAMGLFSQEKKKTAPVRKK